MGRIGLIAVDSNHPNLALMKISRWHKAQGDTVEWYNGIDHYDKVYAAKVFTFTPDFGYYINAGEVERGGTGYDIRKVLPPEVDRLQPDYTLYPQIDRKTAYLISSGTAICGGSAIAAVAPVVKADDNQMSVSLGTIFVLNAIALFIFPPIGHWLGMTQEQCGEWAAIAIHDTSSVVGAGEAFDRSYFPGAEGKALQIATLIKCTRALWIIPLALITTLIFKEKNSKIYIPWFIFLFVLAMVANTYIALPTQLTGSLVWLAKKGLTVTLFLIGSGLSVDVLRSVGIKPMVQGILLWIVIALLSLAVIML